MWWWWFTARFIFFLSLHSSTCHRVKIRLMYSDSHPPASFHTLINSQMPKSTDSNKPSLTSFTDLTRLHSKGMAVAAVNHHHHHILSFFSFVLLLLPHTHAPATATLWLLAFIVWCGLHAQARRGENKGSKTKGLKEIQLAHFPNLNL
ncbi:uncharacterized protein G2W53_015742 [Senna tora]|uniref:Uncharacterized protein n=1 Tax=Senna tora TaxID=362788 RepID=A0A834WVW5_9FABA|nr:uncharacterized protein G2W53_015742 [Senna tora]